MAIENCSPCGGAFRDGEKRARAADGSAHHLIFCTAPAPDRKSIEARELSPQEAARRLSLARDMLPSDDE